MLFNRSATPLHALRLVLHPEQLIVRCKTIAVASTLRLRGESIGSID